MRRDCDIRDMWIAQLDEGRPISLQGYNLGNVTEGALFELMKG